MEKHHKLQKAISEILEPNLEDRLVFGATYLFDNRSNNVIVRSDEDNIRFGDNGTISLNRIKPEIAIGLPINLERLLLAFAILNPSNAKHKNILYDYSSGEIGYSNCRISWHLGKNIIEQPNTTKDKLYKLFNIE